MYAIAINSHILAVSETLESAMKAVPQIIIRWDGEIRNENSINWIDGGLLVNPQCWIARGKFSISMESMTYEVVVRPITKI